jgi:truncated hemoglobin YjbI
MTDQQAAQEKQQQLFHRLGGAPVVRAAVSSLYQRVLADGSLGPLLAGASLPALRAHHLSFLTALLSDGSALDDGGEALASLVLEKHRRLFEDKGLSEKSFDQFTGHLVDALKSQQIADELVDEAMGRILPLRAVFERGAKDQVKARKKAAAPPRGGSDDKSRASFSKGPGSVASSRSANGSRRAIDAPKTAREKRLAAFLGEDDEGEEHVTPPLPPRKIEIKSSNSIASAKDKKRSVTVNKVTEENSQVDARSRSSSSKGKGSRTVSSQCSRGSDPALEPMTARQLRLAAFLGEGVDEPKIPKAPPRKISIFGSV